jgi:hypothetical protein
MIWTKGHKESFEAGRSGFQRPISPELHDCLPSRLLAMTIAAILKRGRAEEMKIEDGGTKIEASFPSSQCIAKLGGDFVLFFGHGLG